MSCIANIVKYNKFVPAAVAGIVHAFEMQLFFYRKHALLHDCVSPSNDKIHCIIDGNRVAAAGLQIDLHKWVAFFGRMMCKGLAFLH